MTSRRLGGSRALRPGRATSATSPQQQQQQQQHQQQQQQSSSSSSSSSSLTGSVSATASSATRSQQLRGEFLNSLFSGKSGSTSTSLRKRGSGTDSAVTPRHRYTSLRATRGTPSSATPTSNASEAITSLLSSSRNAYNSLQTSRRAEHPGNDSRGPNATASDDSSLDSTLTAPMAEPSAQGHRHTAHGMSSRSGTFMLNDSFGESERASVLQRRIDELEDREIAQRAELAQARSEVKRLEIALQKEGLEVHRLKAQRENDSREHAKQLEQVERQRNMLHEREKLMQGDLAEAEEKNVKLRKSNFETVQRLQDELRAAQDELTASRTDANKKIAELAEVNVGLHQQLERANEAVEEKGNIITSLNSRLAIAERSLLAPSSPLQSPVAGRGKRQADEGENAGNDKRSKFLPSSLSSSSSLGADDSDRAMPTDASVRRRLRKLEHENKRLKQMSESALVLKEQYATAQATLHRVSEQLDVLRDKTADYDLLQAFHTKWVNLADAFSLPLLDDDGQETERVLASLRELQEQSTVLQYKLTQKEAETEHLTSLQKKHAGDIARLHDDLEQAKASVERLQYQRDEFKNQYQLAKQQANKLWASYRDVTKYSTVGETQAQLTTEFEKLKKYNESLQDKVATLLQELSVAKTSAVDAAERLNAEIRALSAENSELRARCEAEAPDAADPSVKILHLKSNPVLWAMKEQIMQLEEEKRELTEKIGQISGSRNGPSSNNNQDLKAAARVRELEAEVEQRDLRMKRLKETFKTSIDDFRSVCYELTGYRIQMLQSDRFQLQSMYAENEDDALIFQRGEGKELTLLESQFAAQLDDNIISALTQAHSIPAFLSSVTLDLFSRTTVL